MQLLSSHTACTFHTSKAIMLWSNLKTVLTSRLRRYLRSKNKNRQELVWLPSSNIVYYRTRVPLHPLLGWKTRITQSFSIHVSVLYYPWFHPSMSSYDAVHRYCACTFIMLTLGTYARGVLQYSHCVHVWVKSLLTSFLVYTTNWTDQPHLHWISNLQSLI